jgi:hypothetical protein
MDRPTSLEVILERLAVLDHQIEMLQDRLVRDAQKIGHAPLHDLEQTLSTLIGSRAALHGHLSMLNLSGLSLGPPGRGGPLP